MTATQPTAKEALLKRANIARNLAAKYEEKSVAMYRAAQLLRDKFYHATAADVEKNAVRAHESAEDMRREYEELIKQADESP